VWVTVWRAATIQYASQPSQSIPIRDSPENYQRCIAFICSFAEKVKRRREANANPTKRGGPTWPDGFGGVQILALPGDDYGAQVVYGSPLPTPSVPDGGGTAGLTCLACSLLFWMRSRIRNPFAHSGLIQRITNHNSKKP
jgi:hypothetical protein